MKETNRARLIVSEVFVNRADDSGECQAKWFRIVNIVGDILPALSVVVVQLGFIQKLDDFCIINLCQVAISMKDVLVKIIRPIGVILELFLDRISEFFESGGVH